ncbi:TRAP transporter small permease subunit [Leucothrix pacifica]|uniref:TRAP transporter small permease protein n=1 Tax=Leucothrix pacifica TaxID=1247513 RepID=A0A317CBK2_9GAMM|nr:TRAP transporter small permease [Leucothrix pacifica]PWQ96014.1 TRAP transporter small permease [Leucothrix pacifica]
MVEHERRGWLDEITWRISRVAMIMVAIIVIIMMYEVFMRYVLEKPTIWVNEMSLWMGGWVYLSAGLYAMQQRSHIRITILYDIVPQWLRKVFELLSTLFIVLFTAATVWGGFNESQDALINWERFGTAWDPPIPAVTQPLILVVLVLITIQAVSNLIMDWDKLGHGIEMDDEMKAEVEEMKRAQGISDEDIALGGK